MTFDILLKRGSMSFLNVEKKIDSIKKQLHESSDVASRLIQREEGMVGFVYLKSITDGTLFAESIFKPISAYVQPITTALLRDEIIKTSDVKEIESNEILDQILKGAVVILLENQEKPIAVDILKFPARIPSEPPTSPVIQGPREGFTEDIQTNITLLRRRIMSESLVLKQVTVGKYSNTRVIVSYIDGIANKKIVALVLQRLKKIDIDGIIDSYYIMTFLQAKPRSLFRQVGNSEKPDIIASKLLEGRVAIIVDNSPIVLTVPFVIFEDMQSSNDYYTNHHYTSLIRAIRMIGVLIAILAPGMYLSLQLYHYNVLPLNFLITIADTTQGLPFTPFLEILFIFLLFQILYEVSLRLPSYLGLATSVVGALILGDTGVKAGLISPPGVIIVAVAKIALYTVPAQSSQITILQVVFIFLGGSLGMLGLLSGMIYMTNYMNTLDSFGTPYLAPYGPRISNDLQDGLFKTSLVDMKTRPKSFNSKNRERLK